ncbi:ATP-binding cassette domain-containing protein [bacterium]|nr:ATP-binding cassette domain-containing protein [bacterium]
MIEVREVSKRFGSTVALDGVSLQVERGSVLGFLGPNGAGKSTAMKIITSFLAPDAGTVTVDGLDVREQPLAVRRKIGYQPENVPLYTDMRVHEYLEFVGRSRGLAGAALAARLDWVREACGITRVYKQTIGELSKGFRQRTGLAQALVHDPEILILDEPTTGLDPLQIIGIRELIGELGRTKTIIFSTHVLQEVAPVTDRVVIINQGRVIADGRIAELQRRAMGSNRLLLGFEAVPEDLKTALAGLAGFQTLLPLGEQAPGRFELRGDFAADLAGGVASLARTRGWRLRELAESPFSLEDTFIALTKQAGGSEDMHLPGGGKGARA